MVISDGSYILNGSKRDSETPLNPTNESKDVTVDGHSLDIATVVAVARAGRLVDVDAKTKQATQKGASLLESELDRGNIIYGVNTGFGGSADTRTRMVKELQATLIRELDSGILTGPSRVEVHANPKGSFTTANANTHNDTCMPEEWVRASMVIRINSLVTGHSGVRPVLVERIVDLLKHDIVPRIPLRGSISASGDLMPLSYLGSTLQGKHNTMVWAGKKPNRRLVSAAEALSEANLSPIEFGPKEGLAIINGTAVSTGVGLLAVHDASSLALLSQVLTAMSVESLRGTTESFDPVFDRIRAHTGQREAATNIRRFLAGSHFTLDNDGSEEASLRQDRYAIRTASQWVGPVLEDLELASRQITIECNSVTDNPLIDFGLENSMANPRILHGGNFQAKAVTSAVEKTRLGLQSIGQMLFAQCTEIINPQKSNGLPPNLGADEPSQSFLCKPVDIMMAALQSELGFLANPAGTAVQSAEMGNQSLNSLALVSSRYTHVALDVLSQMAACHVFVVCQALDLRAMHLRFLNTFRPKFADILSDTLGSALPIDSTTHSLATLENLLWAAFIKQLDQTTTQDSSSRFPSVIKSMQPIILEFASSTLSSPLLLPAVMKFTEIASTAALSSFQDNRDTYHTNADAKSLLGEGSRVVYSFVRTNLAVPFVRTDMLKEEGSFYEEGIAKSQSAERGEGAQDGILGRRERAFTTGEMISRIYEAVRDGRLSRAVVEYMEGSA